MTDPRQGARVEGGRVNQKRRTRSAIVAAAKRLLDEGTAPTVPQAAEAALVSRTTAYRYFPTQESLLLEVAVDVGVDDIEALVARPADGDVAERLAEVLTTLARRVLDDEARYRALLRLYQDVWLAASTAGDEAPVIREGRRARWIRRCLEPVAGATPPDDLERLGAALAMLTGVEAVVVLRDVCRLGPDDAVAVIDWAVRTLVAAALPAGAGD